MKLVTILPINRTVKRSGDRVFLLAGDVLILCSKDNLHLSKPKQLFAIVVLQEEFEERETPQS